MLMDVKPGSVLISFKMTLCSFSVTKKSTRERPSQPSRLYARTGRLAHFLRNIFGQTRWDEELCDAVLIFVVIIVEFCTRTDLADRGSDAFAAVSEHGALDLLPDDAFFNDDLRIVFGGKADGGVELFGSRHLADTDGGALHLPALQTPGN